MIKTSLIFQNISGLEMMSLYIQLGVLKNTINTICTGYPKEIIFNMETKIIQGKFLNIRVINFPKQINPMTSVLRKPNNKYNITPPNSNVSWKFKKMAGVSYFHTARTHCTDKKELQNQLKIVRGILELKGFSKNQVKCMELHKKKDKPNKVKNSYQQLSRMNAQIGMYMLKILLETFR